ICRSVPDWKQAGVWFCGPAGFGAMLRDTLAARGLPAERFHQELFEMR
ncbi:MAG: ferric reductase, partial [Thauera aminoaromatica]